MAQIASFNSNLKTLSTSNGYGQLAPSKTRFVESHVQIKLDSIIRLKVMYFFIRLVI